MKYTLIFILLVYVHNGYSQPCDTPPFVRFCEEAPILCSIDELNGYCLAMEPIINGAGPNPLCSQGGEPHNVHWFAFYAGCTNFSITLTPSNCMQGSGGIQAAIYGYGGDGLCTDSNQTPAQEIACQTIPCFTMPVVLEANGLTIGQIYYLIVDGCAGSFCDVSFQLNSPCGGGDIMPWVGPIQGPDRVCIGHETLYMTAEAPGASTYHWYLDGIKVQSGPEDIITFESLWAGIFELCVDASSSCVSEFASPPPQCIQIEVIDFSGIDPDPVGICRGETYIYNGQQYPPGNHYVSLLSHSGCDSVVLLSVYEVPSDTTVLATQFVCPGSSIIVGGQMYSCSDIGKHQRVLGQQVAPFCDSILIFEIACLEAVIDSHGILSPTQEVVILDGAVEKGPSGQYFTYEWFSEDGVLPDTINIPKIEVRDPGTYCIIVSLYTSDSILLCRDTSCAVVSGLIQVPPQSTCQEAALLCPLVSRFSLSMTPEVSNNGPDPMCGELGKPENTHWLAFYAPCTTLGVRLSPSNCVGIPGQEGIQAAFYRYGGGLNCTNSTIKPDEILACRAVPCFNTPWDITLEGLAPGEIIYLLIDGCSEGICDVDISFELPCMEPEIPIDWQGGMQGPDQLCTGKEGVFEVSYGPPGVRYYWYVDSVLSHVTNEPSTSMSWQVEGEYEVCANLDPSCPLFTGHSEKCQTVKVVPEVNRNTRKIWLCQEDDYLQHGVYWSCQDEGENKILFQQENHPHCDSTVTFELVCLSPKVNILPPGPFTPGDTLMLDGSASYPGPAGSVVTWTWSAYNGGTLTGPTDQPQAYALSAGQYCLQITASSPNGVFSCNDMGCVTIQALDGSAEPRSTGEEQNMWVFPSPANDRIWIRFSEAVKGEGILLFHNNEGREVHRVHLTSDAIECNFGVAEWMPGLYTVTWIGVNRGVAVTKRWLIVR